MRHFNMIQIFAKVTAVICALIMVGTQGYSKVKVVKCNPKASTSFAIFVDQKTYDSCKEEIDAYRDVLQSEGLGTYILSSQWEKPEDVKAEIKSLVKNKAPRILLSKPR